MKPPITRERLQRYKKYMGLADNNNLPTIYKCNSCDELFMVFRESGHNPNFSPCCASAKFTDVTVAEYDEEN